MAIETQDATNTQQQAHLEELAGLWSRWTALLAQLARSRKKRLPITSEAYRKLHADLLQACRCAAEDVDEPTRQAVQRLQRTVAPWVDLGTLAAAKQRDIARLLDQSDEASSVLEGHGPNGTGRQTSSASGRRVSAAVWVVAFLLGLALGLLVLGDGVSLQHSEVRYTPQLWLLRLKFAVMRAGFFKVFSIITIVVVVSGGLILYSTKRS